MAEKLSIQIALEGGAEIERQLADIGAAGQKAFADISKSAEQAGGFKELKPEEITKKLEDVGLKGTEAFDKIQTAVKSAGRWEGLVQNVAALETAFVTVAKAAAIVGTAVVAAGVALSKYTSQAAEVAAALRPLADLSGQSTQSLSELQIVFAQGGVSAQKFASEFTALEQKVQEASRSMAEAVEQSSQRIAKSRTSEAQAALSVVEAELALRDAQLKAQGRTDPTPAKTARLRAQLAVEAAELRLQQAQQAQQDAIHQRRVAEANDLNKNIKLYQDMAKGVPAAFDPLTTQATKSAALLGTLAKAGNNWESVLADILKNATELERVQIGKQLGLDQKTIDTLKVGSAELARQRRLVRDLGIALTDTDSNKLKAFNDSWTVLGATAGAALQKIGALLAPLGTLLAQGLTIALVQIVQGIQTTVQEFQALWRIVDAIATIGARGIGILVTLTMAGWEFVREAIDFVATIGAKGIGILVTLTMAGWEFVKEAIDFIANIGAKGITIAVNFILANIETLIQRLRELQAPGAPLPEPGGTPMASGGLLGGRGTGTSDSNLAWLSRGEHIMPARAVAQPGVLAFLEALRRSGGNLSRVLDGMGRFALGGMVPRPAMAFAGGGLAGGMSNVTIQFPGLPAIGGLRASSDVVDQLHKAAALAQVRSGGRKPSRYS